MIEKAWEICKILRQSAPECAKVRQSLRAVDGAKGQHLEGCKLVEDGGGGENKAHEALD